MFSILLAALAATESAPCPSGSEEAAIRRVEDCVCYKSVEGQKLEPWQLAWEDAAKLREQFSHCECKVTLDMRAVMNPRRYVVPGTVVK